MSNDWTPYRYHCTNCGDESLVDVFCNVMVHIESDMVPTTMSFCSISCMLGHLNDIPMHEWGKAGTMLPHIQENER